MALSEYEQRVIDDLERSLQKDDPKLAHAFENPSPHTYFRIVGLVIGLLVGLGLIALGVMRGSGLLVAVGFGAVFTSLALGATSRKGGLKIVEDDAPRTYQAISPKQLATTNASEPNARFMGRLEDRWNRRQEAS